MSFHEFALLSFPQIQTVPLICWQLRTKFWKLKHHICQKMSPVLKFLNKKLSDGSLKPGKIKSEVFLNLKSKKVVKLQKRFCTVPPEPAPEPAIWKLFIQEFQNRAYFLAYVMFQFSNFCPKLSTYRWDTLYNRYSR